MATPAALFIFGCWDRVPPLRWPPGCLPAARHAPIRPTGYTHAANTMVGLAGEGQSIVRSARSRPYAARWKRETLTYSLTTSGCLHVVDISFNFQRSCVNLERTPGELSLLRTRAEGSDTQTKREQGRAVTLSAGYGAVGDAPGAGQRWRHQWSVSRSLRASWRSIDCQPSPPHRQPYHHMMASQALVRALVVNPYSRFT